MLVVIKISWTSGKKSKLAHHFWLKLIKANEIPFNLKSCFRNEENHGNNVITLNLDFYPQISLC